MLPMYPIGAAIRKSSWTGDPQRIGWSSGAPEEAAVVISVSVDSSGEAFRRAEAELHTIFIARLTHCKSKIKG